MISNYLKELTSENLEDFLYFRVQLDQKTNDSSNAFRSGLHVFGSDKKEESLDFLVVATNQNEMYDILRNHLFINASVVVTHLRISSLEKLKSQVKHSLKNSFKLKWPHSRAKLALEEYYLPFT